MPRVTSEEKLRRDARVVHDRARGFQWATVAERNDLTDRQCRMIWNEHLRGQPLGPDDPTDAVREAVAEFDAAIEELALLAETTNNDPVRLGSIRVRLEAIEQRDHLLRSAGVLPFAPRSAINDAEIRYWTEQFVRVLKKYDAPAEALDELQALTGSSITTSATSAHRGQPGRLRAAT